TALRIERRVPRLTATCVDAVRADMLDRGLALVKSPRLFDEHLFLRLPRSKTVLPPDSKRWGKLPELAAYASWLEELLGLALPEEAVGLVALEFRHEPDGFEDRESDRLHVDGSYIRTVCTLFGRSTLYQDEDGVRPVPDGHTLIMTA